MKKRYIIPIMILSLLGLSACGNSNSSTAKSKTSAEIRTGKIETASKKFKQSATDSNLLELVTAELGNNHVVAIKENASAKYSVIRLKGYTLKSNKEYKNLAKSVNALCKDVNKTNYLKSGLGFIQYSKKNETQFSFSYSKKSIQAGKPSLSDINADPDSLFEDATSYYIDPNFLVDKFTISISPTVKAGPTDSQDEGLNEKIMETFK